MWLVTVHSQVLYPCRVTYLVQWYNVPLQAEREEQEQKKAKLETMTLDKKRQIDSNAVALAALGHIGLGLLRMVKPMLSIDE